MQKSSITSKHAEVIVLVVMRSVVWVNTLQVQVRVPARTANKKLRCRFESPQARLLRREYPPGCKRCRFESPHARLIRREYPQGSRVVWVNTLQVQVRVPARTANKKLSVLVVMRSVVWVNTLQVQVRVPARTANKKLRCRFEYPQARLIRREYPPACKRLRVQVPAHTATKKGTPKR
ncbi:unnamed protein product [Boreogadus saida]